MSYHIYTPFSLKAIKTKAFFYYYDDYCYLLYGYPDFYQANETKPVFIAERSLDCVKRSTN